MKINDLLSMSNRDFSTSIKRFQKACEKAGVEPTKRQAAKWRNKKGAAYKTFARKEV